MVIAALALGCSGAEDADEPSAANGDTTTTLLEEATLPNCASLEGDVDLDSAGDGCMLADDSVGVVVSYECDDGRAAVQVGDRIGVEGGQWQPATDGMAPTDLC